VDTGSVYRALEMSCSVLFEFIEQPTEHKLQLEGKYDMLINVRSQEL